MKLDRLETHDRLLHFKKDQALNISQGAEDCLKCNHLSLLLQQYSPYIYIWAHPRTADDGFTKRMLWQPRLTKPTPQTNSYLFRATSHSDALEICWMLPPREQWDSFNKGNVTENEFVLWSINQFENNRKSLGDSMKDDLSDEQVKNIYLVIAKEVDAAIRMDKLYSKPDSLEA